MPEIRVVFFGTTRDSVIVLDSLCHVKDVICQTVVTQPAKPVGRRQILTATPVETWAKKNSTTVLTFPTTNNRSWEYVNEQSVIDTLQTCKADLLISASYGQKIPAATIDDAKYGGLNVHPSLLPRWRGGDPVPWAIMNGDHQTGVTVVTLSPDEFDNGAIIAQKKIPLTEKDSTIPLRKKLFTIGAKLLVDALPAYLNGKNNGVAQKIINEPRARRLTRDDGFESWEHIREALSTPAEAVRIDRKFRALHPWPGLWTMLNGKRVKILSLSKTQNSLLLQQVQLEGKTPVSWEQFKSVYLSP